MAFRFRLETADGRPAEPAHLTSAIPNMSPWRQPPVLVVEDMAE
jgi:hypothetical protein